MQTATTSRPPARRAARPQRQEGGFYRPHDYRPDESVAYLMHRTLVGFKAEVEHELDPRGLTNAQWVPLYKLYLGHASTAAELARECQLDAGAMTRTLDRLEAKGLIRRTRSSEDRRVMNLELTDEGRKAADLIPHALCKVLNAHLAGFSPDEVELLKSMLGRMLENGQLLQQQREGAA
jgi:DNA-binding MarR family transcriptional regulator